MDRERLERYLHWGYSLGQIGALEGRDPSTVGYWVNKYGLVPIGRAKYAPRGEISAAVLEALLERQLTIREMAAELDRSESTVNYWLRRHGVKSRRGVSRRDAAVAARLAGQRTFEHACSRHGVTTFHVLGNGRSRCAKCSSEAVQRRRLKTKATLAEEAGGRCQICGYNRYVGALQFHHLDPRQKRFAISAQGVTRAIAISREEAKKCALLCANCHAEVEAGVATVS